MRKANGQKTLPLIEQLLEISDEIADEMTDAGLKVTPEHLREEIGAEMRLSYRMLVPVTLECVACGSTPGEEYLEPIRQVGRRLLKAGLSPSTGMNIVRTSAAVLPAIKMRYATPADAAEVITTMGRGATIAHLYTTVYISSIERSPRIHPEWWSVEPAVVKRSLRLLAEGYSTHEISTALGYSERMVTYHLAHLMHRFGCSNRTEMVSRAYEAGVLGAGDEFPETVTVRSSLRSSH